MDVAALAELLQETAERHHPYEQSGPAHNWRDWYAAYLDTRLRDGTPDEAWNVAGRYMDGLLGVAGGFGRRGG